LYPSALLPNALRQQNQDMKRMLAGLAFAALTCTASPLTEASKLETPAEKKSASLQGAALRVATRTIYNVGAIDTTKPLLPQAMAIATPEPNANFMIGAGLLGVAYLLQRRTKRTN
jgi:hypothetical protein